MMMPFDSNSLQAIKEHLPKVRAAFEMHVESVALEVTDIAKQISSAIGEISYDEARAVIIREFTNRINERVEIK